MEFDLIIIGGGLVGGTLARALGVKGFKVVVIDAAPPCPQLPPDRRTSAVSASSYRLLSQLQIWEALEAYAAPISKILIGDQGKKASLIYDSQELSPVEPLGYMVPNHKLRLAVYEAASQTPGVTWVTSCRPHAIQQSWQGISIETDQKTFHASLCIGADGKNSWTREFLKIKSFRWAYHQEAMIAICDHPYEHQGIAVEWFTPQGPLALLPMSGKSTAIVWSVNTDKIDLLKTSDDLKAISFLNETYQDHRGPLSFASPRSYYPLEVILPQTTISQRVCLVGDAGHCIHPVAGQGVNVGFRDVEGIVKALTFAKAHGLDLGSEQVLKSYQRLRRFDQLSMTFATDGVVRLFSNNSPTLKSVRALGLRLVGRLPSLRYRMMRHAMGYQGTQKEAGSTKRLDR